MSVKIKICGLTETEKARYAAMLGASAIGLIFHSASPRNVTPAQAAEIRKALPPFTSAVAVLVNPSVSFVETILKTVRPDVLQFHGDESEKFCASFGTPYIKSIRALSQARIKQEALGYPSAAAFLLDTAISGPGSDPNSDKTDYGGSGKTFDWTQIPRDLPKPMIIAGGLNPDNVGALLRTYRPYAVDVSSGVEADKISGMGEEMKMGIKDKQKISNFIAQVRNARLDTTTIPR